MNKQTPRDATNERSGMTERQQVDGSMRVAETLRDISDAIRELTA